MRNVFFALGHLINGYGTEHNASNTLRHQDQHIRLVCGGLLRFLWRPFITDLLRAVHQASPTEPLVLSGGLWDALHKRNISSYREGVDELHAALATRQGLNFWLTATAVHDEALQTIDKRTWMRDSIVNAYRTEAQSLHTAVTVVVDTYALTAPVRALSADGVHYPPHVYLVSAEMVAHTLVAAMPRHARNLSKGRPPTGLGYPWRGLGMLLALAVCIIGLGGKELSVGAISVGAVGVRAAPKILV